MIRAMELVARQSNELWDAKSNRLRMLFFSATPDALRLTHDAVSHSQEE
jgi:hypothetical protein